MNRRNPQPQQQVDASGDCRHLYLTRDATCVHCGLQFRLAWASERRDLVKPTTRNLIFAIIGVILFVPAQAFPIGGSSILASVFLVIAVLFFTRTMLGGFALYSRHGFVPGKLGPIAKRHTFNPLPPKPYITTLGAVRFPIDLATYRQFEQGDTLLFEHLRWSRLPVAIYKGYPAG